MLTYVLTYVRTVRTYSLTYFGQGSKTAAFYYGDTVRCVTCHLGDARAARATNVDEMVLSTSSFQEAIQNHEDWAVSDIKPRPLYDEQDSGSVRRFHEMHADAGEHEYVKKRMQSLEREKCSFTLFVISNIKKTVRKELTINKMETLCRELRDFYFVYLDALHHQLHKVRDLPHENMEYRYGPVDIQMFGVHSVVGSDDYTQSFHKSLRVSSERLGASGVSGVSSAGGSLILPPHNFTSEQVSAHDDRLLTLCRLMAPDVFRFKIKHASLGLLEGMVLYLPCKDGMESHHHVSLHDESRAVVFWKGRLIPYASLKKLLPFMIWGVEKRGRSGQRLQPHEKEMQERTVLLLFMDGVSGVDVTKFNISDDLEEKLGKYPEKSNSQEPHEFEWAWHWDTDKER